MVYGLRSFIILLFGWNRNYRMQLRQQMVHADEESRPRQTNRTRHGQSDTNVPPPEQQESQREEASPPRTRFEVDLGKRRGASRPEFAASHMILTGREMTLRLIMELEILHLEQLHSRKGDHNQNETFKDHRSRPHRRECHLSTQRSPMKLLIMMLRLSDILTRSIV